MIVLANKETALNKAIQTLGTYEVKIVPYSEGVLPVVMEMRPEIVVLSPYLPGKIDPAQVLYELTMLDHPPRIILLAGNMDKKDPFIQEAVSSQVFDIVFNPNSTKKDLTDHMVKEIVDRIEHPRTRKQIFMELGISSRKHVPLTSFETVTEREEDSTLPSDYTVKVEEHHDEEIVTSPQKPKFTRPYIVGVVSPSSCGGTFISQNVATTMALENYHTALIDFDGKRSLHHWFGRDIQNQSFIDLFEGGEVVEAETIVQNLDVFSSLAMDEEFLGDVGWMRTVERLPYEIAVLDFSSGEGWRIDLLVKALEQCDEVLFVLDMDYSKSLRSRKLLELLSQKEIFIRLVMNKWDVNYLPCEERDLAPLSVSYYIPMLHEVYTSIVAAKPLVAINPELKRLFLLKSI